MSKERLVELIDTFCKKENVLKFNKEILDKFADYLFADGWIRPPCKVGDTVWSAFWSVRSHKVIRIEITESELIVATNDYRFNFSDFGRVVFLTREEAEAKLEESESK